MPLHITSSDNPRIKAVVRLHDSRQRRQTGLFIVQSRRELERAMAAGLRLREVYLCPEILDEALDLDEPDVSVFTVTPALMAKMTPRQNPEGVVAVFEQRHWQVTDLPAPNPQQPDLLLLAVGIEKPGNLGAMARTLAAAGGTALLVVDAVIDIYNPATIRTSTGAVFSLPIIPISFGQTMNLLRGRQTTLIATFPDATTTHTRVDMTGPVAIAIGAEDSGLDGRWRQAVHELAGHDVCIAMPGSAMPGQPAVVDSLNASTAAGVLLFEAVRQRVTSSDS